MSRRKPTEPLVCVIRDTSNVYMDYYLPLSDAEALYNQGLLQYDHDNDCYALPPSKRIVTLPRSSYTRTSQ